MALPDFLENFLPPGDGADGFRRLSRAVVLLAQQLNSGCAAELDAATPTGDFFTDGFNDSWSDTCDYLIVYLDNGDVYMAFNKSERFNPMFAPSWVLVFAASGAAETVFPGMCQARLSLSSSDAAPAADQTAQTTLYLLPHLGNFITIYDGVSAWGEYTLASAGINIAIPATTDTNYDVFVYYSSGLLLELVAWTNDTTRATELVKQDGSYVKSGDTTRLYVGTVRTTGVSGQCEDSEAKRLVYNYFNRVPRSMQVQEATANWAYGTSTWRSLNNSTVNRLQYVVGVNDQIIDARAEISMAANVSDASGMIGIGLDSTSSPASDCIYARGLLATGFSQNLITLFNGYTGIGYHYLQFLEWGSGSGFWYGSDVSNGQSGIQGVIWS